MIISPGDYIEGKTNEGDRVGGIVFETLFDDYLEETFIKIESKGQIHKLMSNQILKLEKSKSFDQLAKELHLDKDQQIEILKKYIGNDNGKLSLFVKTYLNTHSIHSEEK